MGHRTVRMAVVAVAIAAGIAACGSDDGSGGGGAGQDAGTGGSTGSGGASGASSGGNGGASGGAAGAAGMGGAGGTAGSAGSAGRAGTGGSSGAPGPGRFLAYISDADSGGVFELYAVDLSGTAPAAPVKLSALGGAKVSGFSWSPDGTKLAYLAPPDIYFVDVSTKIPGTPAKLNAPLAAGGTVSPASITLWTPSSNGIVFSEQAPNSSYHDLFYAETSTSQPAPATRLHPLGTVVHSPALSADGTKVAFIAGFASAGPLAIHVVDLTQPQPFAAQAVSSPLTSGADVTAFAWSPDGKRFVATIGATNSETLFLVDLSGSTPKDAVLNGTGNNNFFDDIKSVKWLPDGSGVVYTHDADIDKRYELFLTRISVGAPEPAIRMHAPLTIGGVGTFEISPDSQRVVYGVNTTGTSSEVWVVDVAGGAPKTGTKLVGGSAIQAGDVAYEVSSDSQWALIRAFDNLFAAFIGTSPPAAAVQVHPTLPSGQEVSAFDLTPSPAGFVYRVADAGVGGSGLWWVTLGTSLGTPVELTGASAVEAGSGFLRSDAMAAAYRASGLYYVDLSGAAPAPPVKASGPNGFVLDFAFGK